jgi:hypothetical protein
MLIVARNWDRFGGRSHEILNAFLISKVFELDFAFIWPKIDIFPDVNEQFKFFSDKFIAKHKIEQIPQKITPFTINKKKNKNEIRSEILKLDVEAVYLTNFFEIPKISGLDTYSLFAELRFEVWSDEVLTLAKNISQKLTINEIRKTLHCRYGDLVSGEFRHYVDMEKYIPFAVVRQYLDTRVNENILIISDTQEVCDVLEALYPNVFSRKEITTNYSNNVINNDIIDLIILQESIDVIAPKNSAYSKLGAHLSGSEPRCLVEEISEEAWTLVFESALNQSTYKELDIALSKQIQSRDIIWLLDYRCTQLGVKRFGIALDMVSHIDPRNVIAQSLNAIRWVGVGNFENAMKSVKQSVSFGDQVKLVSKDPLFYAYSVQIVIDILYLQHIKSKFFTFRKRELQVQKISQLLQLLNTLDPYQIPKEIVLSNIKESINQVTEKDSHRLKNVLNKIRYSIRKLLGIQKEKEIYAIFQNYLFKESQYTHFLTRVTIALRESIDL